MLHDNVQTKLSKFMCKILRHSPEDFGLSLDPIDGNVQAAPVILKQGLRPMKRQYVHLSEGLHFATLAGKRRGELMILAIDTEKASRAGVVFYYAGNEVWLADAVPAEFCRVYGDEKEVRHYE